MMSSIVDMRARSRIIARFRALISTHMRISFELFGLGTTTIGDIHDVGPSACALNNVVLHQLIKFLLNLFPHMEWYVCAVVGQLALRIHQCESSLVLPCIQQCQK